MDKVDGTGSVGGRKWRGVRLKPSDARITSRVTLVTRDNHMLNLHLDNTVHASYTSSPTTSIKLVSVS